MISHLTCQALEAVVFLPDAAVFPGKPAHAEKAKDGGFVATAGDKGQVRVWDLSTRSAVAEEHDKSAALTHLLYVQLHFHIIPTLLWPTSFTSYSSSPCSALPNSAQLIGVTTDHNFLFKELESLSTEKLLVGYNDEVTDIRFVKGGAELAVATNSSQIRVFDKATHACRMLSGHTDTVLAIDTTGGGAFLVSAGKDHTARVRPTFPANIKVSP